MNPPAADKCRVAARALKGFGLAGCFLVLALLIGDYAAGKSYSPQFEPGRSAGPAQNYLSSHTTTEEKNTLLWLQYWLGSALGLLALGEAITIYVANDSSESAPRKTFASERRITAARGLCRIS